MNICTGKLDANAAVEDGDFPFFTCSQTPSRIDRFSFDTDAVLLAGNGDFNVKYYSGKFDAYQRTYVIEPVGWSLRYCFTLVMAQISEFTKNNRGSAIAYLKLGDLTNPVFAIPPLSEQERIVAKVDEIMALCDQLEQQQEASISAHQTLVLTLLDSLTGASESHGFNAAWARISQHFDGLFSTEWSVDQLRKTIVHLAVKGKIVPENRNDLPASELLKKIASEKKELFKKGKIKRPKHLPPILEHEKCFELPVGWEWERLGNVALLSGGFAYKSKEFVDSGIFQVVRMGNIRPNLLRPNQNPVFITSEYADKTRDYKIAEGDILLTMTGTKGKRDYLYSLVVNSTDLEARSLYLNQRLCSVRPVLVDESYINIVIKDDRLLDTIYTKSTGTANQANIGIGAISNWALPIPPLQQQQRIVAKVNQLMALCDRLKGCIIIAQQNKLQLAEMAVDGLLA